MRQGVEEYEAIREYMLDLEMRHDEYLSIMAEYADEKIE